MAEIFHDVISYQRRALEVDYDFSPHQVFHRGIGSFAGAGIVCGIFVCTVKENELQ